MWTKLLVTLCFIDAYALPRYGSNENLDNPAKNIDVKPAILAELSTMRIHVDNMESPSDMNDFTTTDKPEEREPVVDIFYSTKAYVLCQTNMDDKRLNCKPDSRTESYSTSKLLQTDYTKIPSNDDWLADLESQIIVDEAGL